MKYKVEDYNERYYAGVKLPMGIAVEDTDNEEVPQLWGKLISEVLDKIPNVSKPNKFIGLECFDQDFKKTKRFDYFAMVQTETFLESNEYFVTKKLPKGRYISFDILFDEMDEDMNKCHEYIENNDIEVDEGFDFSEYLIGVNYSESNALLHFTFLLKE